MKSKPQEIEKKPIEVNAEPEFEVKSGGPSIASHSRNKMLIVLASLVLAGFVFYIFFSGDKPAVETDTNNLKPVEAPKKAEFAPSEAGKSPFAFDAPEKTKTSEGIEFLDKPATPDIPSVPELPDNNAALEDLVLAPQDKAKEANKNNAVNQQNQVPPQIPPSQPIPEEKPKPPAPETQKSAENNSPPAAEKIEPEPINPRYSPIIAFGGQGNGGTTMRSVGYENNIINLKSSEFDNLKQLEDKTDIGVIGDRSHVIAQGKFLSAVIESSITTEMPGPIRGIIDRDVYGETGKEILIPRGTRVFGTYSASVRRGQGRVEIKWSRLLRQDGVSVSISFSGADQFGRTGVQGEVDNRYSSVIANSLLTSVLAVGSLAATQGLLGGNNNSTTTVNPGFGTVTTTGNAANQALYDVTKNVINIVSQVLTNSIDLNPIIRIPQGTRVTLIVTQDLRIPSLKANRSGGR